MKIQNNFAMTFGIGVAVIAVAVAGILYLQRGRQMQMPGKVLKVRTAPLDEHSSVAVIDFRVANLSDVLFVVRTVSVEMEDKQGRISPGTVAAEMDTDRLFEAVPLLGQKFNNSLIARDRVPAHTSMDRMIAARFESPESELDVRKRFIVRVEEMDGESFELAER